MAAMRFLAILTVGTFAQWLPEKCADVGQGTPVDHGVAVLTGFSLPEEVAVLLSEMDRGCTFQQNSDKAWAEDCWLNASSAAMQALGRRLLATVVPEECGFKAARLPLRRFSAEEPGAHADHGPSWTVLLHLSKGATCFGDNTSSCLEHAPGDLAVWHNSGHGPMHATRLPAGSAQKVVLNLGLFAKDLAACRGLRLAAAGGGESIYSEVAFSQGCAARNLDVIYDETNCQNAARDYGVTDGGTESTTDRPRGCNYVPNPVNEMKLNVHPTGNANPTSLASSSGAHYCMIRTTTTSETSTTTETASTSSVTSATSTTTATATTKTATTATVTTVTATTTATVSSSTGTTTSETTTSTATTTTSSATTTTSRTTTSSVTTTMTVTVTTMPVMTTTAAVVDALTTTALAGTSGTLPATGGAAVTSLGVAVETTKAGDVTTAGDVMTAGDVATTIAHAVTAGQAAVTTAAAATTAAVVTTAASVAGNAATAAVVASSTTNAFLAPTAAGTAAATMTTTLANAAASSTSTTVAAATVTTTGTGYDIVVRLFPGEFSATSPLSPLAFCLLVLVANA